MSNGNLLSYNFWVGLSEDFQTELDAFLQDGTAPPTFSLLELMSDETQDFFRAMYNRKYIDRAYPSWTSPQNKAFKLRSFYVNKPLNVGQVRSDIDAMENTYGQDFAILGAWHCEDGTQIGGDASPAYPSPSFTINFMPDVIVDPGDPEADPPVPPTTERPTQLSDINVLAGQAKRHFVTL